MTTRTIAIAAAFLVATLSSVASAQVINGCIKNNGTLKIVADLAQCSSRDTPISWNQQGVPGTDGMDGADGLNGMDGSDAKVLHVFDRNGVDIGIYASGKEGGSPNRISNPFNFEVYLPDHAVTFHVSAEDGVNVLSVTTEYLFTDPNCVTTPFVTVAGRLLQPTFGAEDLFVVSSNEAVEISPVAASNRPFPGIGEPCSQTDPTPIFVVPVSQVDPVADLGLSFPLPAPLYAAPAPDPAP